LDFVNNSANETKKARLIEDGRSLLCSAQVRGVTRMKKCPALINAQNVTEKYQRIKIFFTNC
jgi:membrane protein involved in colicin uptake